MEYLSPECTKQQAGIYIIRFACSSKVYIGSSNNLWRRYRRHKGDLRRQAHRTPPLQAAHNKYGLDSMYFEVLLICSEERLLIWEQRLIDLYKAANSRFGYNCSPTAGRCSGIKRTPEQIARMCAAQQAAMTPEKRARIAASSMGVVRGAHSPETKEKIRLGNLGKFVSDETKAKMSAARTGKKNSPETIAKRIASCAATRLAKLAATPTIQGTLPL